MKRLLLVIGPALCISPLHAKENARVEVKPVTSAIVNSGGQPIRLPQGNAQVLVSTYDIPAGAVLPEHMHPFPRFGYVLTGTLRVTNTDTGEEHDYKSGNFVLESVNRWHQATTVGSAPVRLLVIDLTEPGKNNVIMKK